MGDEKKKGGKLKKFFLFAAIAGLVTAIMQFMKRRRGQGMEDNEWQELPPPAGG
jgi:hypothetical protein